MNTEPTCAKCKGPNEIPHTRQECVALAGLLSDAHPVTLALVAGVLAHASAPLRVAARLREAGVVQDLQ